MSEGGRSVGRGRGPGRTSTTRSCVANACSFDDGVRLFRVERADGDRRDGQPGARAQERRRRVLRAQHAPQSDERLHGRLQVLRLLPPVPREGPAAGRWTLERCLDEVRARLGRAADRGAHRRRAQPGLPVRVLHRPDPRDPRDCGPELHVKAFTAAEYDFFAKRFKKPLDEIFDEFKAAGPRLAARRRRRGAGRARAARDLSQEDLAPSAGSRSCALAHEHGLRSNATLLYGHVETLEERVEHLCRLRALQDETGGFMCFIPLAFHPENTELAHLPGPTGFDDLLTIAVSRLMLDNFDHVKAYWIMITPRIAQTALNLGADCIDGTVVEEKIVHMAGAKTPVGPDDGRAAAADPRGRPRAGPARLAVQRAARASTRPPPRERRPRMTRVRIGAVAYLNARPLVVGSRAGPRCGARSSSSHDRAGGVSPARWPRASSTSRCCPSIELARIPDLEIVPGLGITTRGAARSVLLVSPRPLAESGARRARPRVAHEQRPGAPALDRASGASRPLAVPGRADLEPALARARCRRAHRRQGAVRAAARGRARSHRSGRGVDRGHGLAVRVRGVGRAPGSRRPRALRDPARVAPRRHARARRASPTSTPGTAGAILRSRGTT